MTRTRRKRTQAGFTMIEVMVAVLLTSVAMIGVVGLYRIQSKSSSYSRHSTEAAVLAGDKVEALRTDRYPCGLGVSTCTGGPETVDATGATGSAASGFTFQRSWSITQPVAPTTTTDGQWKFAVTVTWLDSDVSKSITVNSITKAVL